MTTRRNLSRFFRALAPARLKRTVQLGLRSLWLHRLRSLLTVLGIVFGECSVIAMLAVGEGASHEAQEQIRRLGSNNVILRSLKPIEDESLSQERSHVLEYGLTYRDMLRIQASIPGIRLIMPGRIIQTFVWNGPHRLDAEVLGTVPFFPDLRALNLTSGRFFTDTEMATSANVCILGASAAERLFPIDQPVGRSVRIGSDYYRVVGVIEGESGMPTGMPQNAGAPTKDLPQGVARPRIYIPLSAAKDRFGEVLVKRSSGSFEAERVQLHEATVQVASLNDVEETARIIGDILKSTHKKRDYAVIVPLELLRQAEQTKRIFNIVLGAIAAISLLVGGIGIMNIMLASVTERTREIGIRRALGARKRDITVQFLVETVILSGAGGIIGVALGIAIPFFITFFAGMETIITVWAPLVAFSISGCVGVIFGIYPARRAANMDPVEALRHE